jgi:choice-of-anchor A domain-containing protein
MNLRLSVFALVVSLSFVPSSARADDLLGTAGQYNIFTLGDFVQQWTDAIGRVAVGGKFDPGGTINSGKLDGTAGYTVASGNPASTVATPNLVVGGNFRNSGTTLNGSAVIGGNAFFSTPTVNGNITTGGDLTASSGGFVNGSLYYGGTLHNNEGYKFYSGTANQLTTPLTLPFNFATEGARLTGLSTTLSGMAGTGTVAFTGDAATHKQGGLTLTGTNSHQDVFHVSGADLALANSFTINAVAGETVVIDIDGTIDQMSSFGFFLNNIDNHHVLYNFSSATELTLSSIGVQGTILAPFADINFNNGNIDGTIIGKSLRGGGESHSFLFTGSIDLPEPPPVDPAAVPEPSSLAIACIGVLVAGCYAHRNRRKS